MATTMLRKFVNDLDAVFQQMKGQNALKIASGSIPNMKQYHRACGRIEGMEQMVKVAREMLGQVENAPDKDDGGLKDLPPAE